MITYATLDEAKAELKAGTTVEDARFFESIRAATRRIDQIFRSPRPFFAPYTETREWLIQNHHVNSALRTFNFEQPLLSLTSVVAGDTTLTVGTTVEAWPTIRAPFYRLRLMSSANNWYEYCNDDDPVMLTIGGIWGFHSDYNNAWLSVETLAAAVSDTTSTSITVADVDGVNTLGDSPRISRGNLLRIESELLEVTATNTTSNVVTVRRGAHGSTAATHIIGSVVEVWQVEETVKRACRRQAAFLYARRGAYESTSISDFGAINYPSDLLAEVRAIMMEFGNA